LLCTRAPCCGNEQALAKPLRRYIRPKRFTSAATLVKSPVADFSEVQAQAVNAIKASKNISTP
jgi:hypothetical protein